MDILQDYAYQAYGMYNKLSPHLAPVNRALSLIQAQTTPLLDRLAIFARDSPAIVSLLVFTVALVILLQILSVVRRIIAFWVTLVFRLVFWMAVGLLISLVWQRGLGRTVDDLVNWAGEVQTVWQGEYKKWEGIGQAQGRGGYASGNNGYGGAGAGGRRQWS